MCAKENTAAITSEGSVYPHPRPEVAVDVVMFGYLPSDRSLRLLLQYRPEEKTWSFPARIVRSAPTRDNNDEKYPGEYGPEAETVPQAFRKALQIKAKSFSRASDEEIVELCMSEHYVPRHNEDIPEDPVEFQKDECLAQLPVRSEIRRDRDRLKNGKPVNKRVISIPILTMASRGYVWDDVNRYRDLAWVPIDWVVEDNMKNTNNETHDSDLRSLFQGDEGLVIHSTKLRNSECYALRFDHILILRSSIYALRQCARCRPIAREALDKQFRVSDLCRIYEYIFNREIDIANLRRVFIKEKDNGSDNLLIVTDKKEKSGTGRKPAILVEFNDNQYDILTERLSFRFPFAAY
jgi:hypothetical protein